MNLHYYKEIPFYMKILSLNTSYRISISQHLELPLFTIILKPYTHCTFIYLNLNLDQDKPGAEYCNQITENIYGLSKSRFEIQTMNP